jgi:hypothetical protein
MRLLIKRKLYQTQEQLRTLEKEMGELTGHFAVLDLKNSKSDYLNLKNSKRLLVISKNKVRADCRPRTGSTR